MKLALTIAACLSFGNLYADEARLLFKPDKNKKFNWASYQDLKKLNLANEYLTIFGPWVGPDKTNFENVIAYFKSATGARVEYRGSDSFERQIVFETKAGVPPNISIFPQPGLASELASQGFLTPLGDETKKWVADNYAAGDSWVNLGTYEGKEGNKQFFGFPYKASVKSLVWYVPKNFRLEGYTVPQSMEELKALTKIIAAKGHKAWCIGVVSGGATGWPATDWVEDMMLRTVSTEDYDKWVSNDLKFDDPKVIAAFEEFGWFAKNNAHVAGSSRAIATTDFRESPKGLFTSPPKCYFHHQASFISSFFPKGTTLGKDADFFYFPAYKNKKLGNPVLGAGTLFTITKPSKAAEAFIDFLKSPIAHEVWMAQAGFLTPLKSANIETYSNPALKKQGRILLNATSFRFDASDLMPSKIGTSAFWSGMIDYTNGESAQVVTKKIQQAWDNL